MIDPANPCPTLKGPSCEGDQKNAPAQSLGVCEPRLAAVLAAAPPGVALPPLEGPVCRTHV